MLPPSDAAVLQSSLTSGKLDENRGRISVNSHSSSRASSRTITPISAENGARDVKFPFKIVTIDFIDFTTDLIQTYRNGHIFNQMAF